MSERIPCSFNLRRARIHVPAGQHFDVRTLGTKIHEFYEASNVADRIRGEGQTESNERQVIDLVSTSGDITQGVVYAWEKGAHARQLHFPENGLQVRLGNAEAQKQEGDKFSEWERGMVFFAIKGDYVAYCTRKSGITLFTETVQDALSKLLGYAVSITLDPLPALDLRDEILNDNVERISVSPGIQTESNQHGRWMYGQRTLRFLGGLLGDTSQQFEEDISNELVVEVAFKPKDKRHLSGESRRALAQIARSLEDFPNMKIRLRDGRELTREKLRINETKYIEGCNHLPGIDILLSKLSYWLETHLPPNADV